MSSPIEQEVSLTIPRSLDPINSKRQDVSGNKMRNKGCLVASKICIVTSLTFNLLAIAFEVLDLCETGDDVPYDITALGCNVLAGVLSFSCEQCEVKAYEIPLKKSNVEKIIDGTQYSFYGAAVVAGIIDLAAASQKASRVASIFALATDSGSFLLNFGSAIWSCTGSNRFYQTLED